MFTETLANTQPPAKVPLAARRTRPAILPAMRFGQLSQEFVPEEKSETNPKEKWLRLVSALRPKVVTGAQKAHAEGS